MWSVGQVVAELQITREEFGVMFLQMQAGTPAEERREFEAIGLSADDQEAYREALLFAQGAGWFEPMVEAIIKGGFESGRLAQSKYAQLPNENQFKVDLQAITNSVAGFIDSFTAIKGAARAVECTGKIVIGAQMRSKGTGVLISPDLVLTAWHVVRDLFQYRNQHWQLLPPSPATRLTVVFNDFSDPATAPQQVGGMIAVYQQGANTVIPFSSCHNDELQNMIPANLAQLANLWDYAIIKLEQPVDKRWIPLDVRSVVPLPDDFIILLQHPEGYPQKLYFGHVVAGGQALKDVVPKYRFLHDCNALGGSSGGPCLDKSFNLIGIHQGTWPSPPGQTRNRGVPIVGIAEHIKSTLGSLSELLPANRLVHNLGASAAYEPVIGCQAFQSALWRMAIVGQRQLMVIAGDSGSGKTFRLKLLQTLLADDVHLKIALKADQLAASDATNLAMLICQGAGDVWKALPSVEELNSTSTVWLKDVVLPRIMSTLDAKRKNRLVWITISDLNKFDLQKRMVSDLLLLLYQQTIETKWLRFVLDGMQGELPAELRDKDLVEFQTAEPIQLGELVLCIRENLAQREIPGVAPIAQYIGGQNYAEYQTRLHADRLNAVRLLKDDVQKFIQDYLAAVKAAG